MAMLNFKHGSYANLFKEVDGVKQVPINNGTIYVTTDEKAMYVDLNDQRIRLSQIITCTYDQWVDLKPPYSTEAFYYIIDKNALLKYNDGKSPAGSDQTLVEGWVQINSTKALSDKLDALQGQVNTLSGTVTSQGTEITGLTTRLGNLETKHQQDVDAINADIGTLESAVLGLDSALASTNKAIGFIGKLDTLPAVEDANVYDVCEHNGVLKILMPATEEGGSNYWTTYKDIVQNIEEIKIRIGGMATDTNMQELTTRVQNLEAWRSTVDGTEGLLAKLREDVNKNAQAAAEAKSAADAAQTTANEAKTAAAAADTKAQKGVDDAAAALTAANSADTKAQKGVDDAAAAQKAAEDAMSAAEERVEKSTFEQFQTSNTAVIDAVRETAQKGVDDAAGALAAAQGAKSAADAAQSTADEALAAANAANTKIGDETGGLVKDIADNKTAAANAQTTANEAKSAATKNATDITGLTTRIGTEENARKEAINDLREEMVGKLQTADAMKFEGTVGSLDELNAVSGISKGATYKATDEFVIGEGDDAKLVHIGDLLIANGTEDAETGLITGVIKWEHVPSGYVADYNPEMTVDAGTNTAEVKLTSGAAEQAGDLGSFSVSADANSAVTVAATGTNIVVGMAWSSFDSVAGE